MPISVQCPECDKKMKVADAVAGKKIRCPACKAVIAVPAAEEEFEQPEEEFETPEEETAVTKTPRSKKSDDSAIKKSKKRDDDEEDEAFEEEEERPRKKKKKKRYDDDDDYDYRGSVRRRAEPHRGVVILILGISSVVVACLCPLICWILAAIAVNMANTDKPKMERRLMDPDGQSLTTAGQVCAYIGVVIGLINCVLGAVLQGMNKF